LQDWTENSCVVGSIPTWATIDTMKWDIRVPFFLILGWPIETLGLSHIIH